MTRSLLSAALGLLCVALVAPTTLWADCFDLDKNRQYQDLSRRAVDAFTANDFEGAIELFEKAREICKYDPSLTYNLASAHLRADHCAVAIELLEETKEQLASKLVPSPLEEDRVDTKLATVRESCVVEEPVAADNPPDEEVRKTIIIEVVNTEPPTPHEERSTVLEWTLLGVGSAILVGGGVTQLIAMSNANGIDSSLTMVDAKARHDDAKTLSAIGISGIGLGSAVLATGVLLLLFGDDDSDVSGQVNLDQTSLAFSVAARF